MNEQIQFLCFQREKEKICFFIMVVDAWDGVEKKRNAAHVRIC